MRRWQSRQYLTEIWKVMWFLHRLWTISSIQRYESTIRKRHNHWQGHSAHTKSASALNVFRILLNSNHGWRTPSLHQLWRSFEFSPKVVMTGGLKDKCKISAVTHTIASFELIQMSISRIQKPLCEVIWNLDHEILTSRQKNQKLLTALQICNTYEDGSA